jgi:hypothetical protein
MENTVHKKVQISETFLLQALNPDHRVYDQSKLFLLLFQQQNEIVQLVQSQERQVQYLHNLIILIRDLSSFIHTMVESNKFHHEDRKETLLLKQ